MRKKIWVNYEKITNNMCKCKVYISNAIYKNITDRPFLCVLQVGERYPAPTQNQRALGGNLHLLQSLWTMERQLGESLLGAAVAGETATQGWHLHLANLVNSSFFLCFY